MAMIKAISAPDLSVLDVDRHDNLGLVISAALPLAVFVILHGAANIISVQPMFFAPFSTPGWVGATIHIVSLGLFGIARWMVASRGAQGRRAAWWLIGLMAMMIVTPFAVAYLDTLALAIMGFVMMGVSLGAVVRVAAVNPRAALVMAPAVGWMVVTAFVSLSLGAAWSPPFAVTSNQPAA